MMLICRIQILAIVFFVLTKSSAAQNASIDFKKINEAYSKYTKLSMEINYKVYETYSSINAIDNQLGVYRKSNKNYYNKLMGIETLVEASNMVTVNNNVKKIIVSNAKEFKGYDISGIDMESLLKNYNKISFVNKDKKTNGYIIELKKRNNQLERFEVYYDVENYLITKLTLFYNNAIDFSASGKQEPKKPRLEIIFKNINTNPEFENNDFKISKYVSLEGKPVLNTNYKNYQLTNKKI